MQFGEEILFLPLSKNIFYLWKTLDESENYSIPSSQYTPMPPCVWFIHPNVVTDRKRNIKHSQVSLINTSHNGIEKYIYFKKLLSISTLLKQANETPSQKHPVTQAENENLFPQENH